MKKYSLIILLVTIITIGVIVYLYSSNSKQDSYYSAKKSTSNNNSINYSTNNISTAIPKTPVENELSIYSTVIKNQKDSNRQGNISITCSALNNTIVKPRRNFFFLRYCWSVYRRTWI